MKSIKLSFKLDEFPCYAISHKHGRKTFEMQAFDGEMTVDVQYDYDRRPLRLSAKVKEADEIEVVLMPHRIELYVGGALIDEEWPKGNRLFELEDEINSIIHMYAEEYHEPKRNIPSVIAEFENADGWNPGNGVFVGDCMPYRRGEEYHILYLKDRHHHRSKWGLGAHQWEHISTSDFKKWRRHPMAVPITDESEGSICTGSWIKNGDKEYLYYTVRMGGGIAAPIRRSVSCDGYHFEKDQAFGFTVSEKYHAESARDPKVIKGEDGLFHMFLTTSWMENGKGCLAHYISRDMESWEETDEPIYIAPERDQPECPDYFKYNGKYYLVFSLKGRAHYMISDKPFEGFVMPNDPIIPCSNVPKGAEWNGRLIFTGFKCIGGYAGSLSFRAATSKENGELVFEDL
jgi:hypothetical protein